MSAIPDTFGASGILARAVVKDYLGGKTHDETVRMWIAYWRAGGNADLADQVERVIRNAKAA